MIEVGPGPGGITRAVLSKFILLENLTTSYYLLIQFEYQILNDMIL